MTYTTEQREHAREIAAEIESHDVWRESTARELCAIAGMGDIFDEAWREPWLRFEEIIYNTADELGVSLSDNHVDMRNFCACCGSYIGTDEESYLNEDGDIICNICHDVHARTELKSA